MRKIKSKITVIGCGSWPTIIAKVCAENGHDVTMWCHRQELCDDINQNHQQSKALPDVTLPPTITATCDPNEAVQNTELVINGLASKYINQLEAFKSIIQAPVISLTKGFRQEGDTLFISDYLNDLFPGTPLGILSGPNLAGEIANQKPAAAVIATTDESVAIKVQSILSNTYFRVYRSTDIRGVEIGGVLKNTMAIAAGCLDGLEMGYNAKSGMITRSLQEILRFGTHIGAQSETLMGLSGLGDLIATCHSPNSRNYRVGVALAKGTDIDEITKHAVAEGINTSKIVFNYANDHDIDMPIATMVYRVVFEQLEPAVAIREIMERDLKKE